MGKPRLPRGIQVTYADVSVAVETVGLSGASGAAGEGKRCQIGQDEKHTTGVIDKNHHLQRAYPSETEEKRDVSERRVRMVKIGNC